MKRIAIITVLLVLVCFSGVYAANNALQFDGKDDYVLVSDSNSLDLTTGMTIEAWIQSSAKEEPMTVISKWYDPTGDHSYILKREFNAGAQVYNKMQIQIAGSNHDEIADFYGNSLVNENQWFHTAVVS